jgi:glycosyltransferase involved in cell wall biosynthesis
MTASRLLLVIPCYNEEPILKQTHSVLHKYCQEIKQRGLIAEDSKICFVNDGSRDKTWDKIEEICAVDDHAIGVKLSRNFGHQSAILAGLEKHMNEFECFITIDADLQDDINAITAMIEKHAEGAKVVYGVRDDRSTDSWFKKFSAEKFYMLMQKMGVPLVFNHADFRLMDRCVLQELGNFKEINLFLRGVIPLIGFRSEKVFYKRLERLAGESKYPLSKMLLFGWNGVTSFSAFPMRLVLYIGFFNFIISMAILIYSMLSYLVGYTVPGWTSTILPMTFFSGSNMMALGLVGEYIGKIYEEVKARPRYIIERII